MLDIKFVRENVHKVKKAIQNKGLKIDVEKILDLDKKKQDLVKRVEMLRAKRNQISGQKSSANIKQGKKIKVMLRDLEPQLVEASEALSEVMYHLPNIPAKDVPLGKNERENKIIKVIGESKKFAFKIKDHIQLGKELDLIDIARAAKVSGSRFYYLKNKAVLLEFAIVRWIMDLLGKEGFVPMIPPILEKMTTAKGTGYFETLNDDAYHTQEEEMVLVGTSEQSIIPYYMDEIIQGEMPKRFVGFSTCFRREAGSYGKDVAGILRVHQFDKLEMISFCEPDKSDQEHEFILSLEEKIIKSLGLTYRVSKMCTGDLGLPAARKYDIEVWIPTQEKYRELTSCSTCTDFQARRLNIRYRDQQGKTQLVHTLNGTGLAIGRALVAIMENNQTKDGSIKIPEVLWKYTGFKSINKK